MYLLCCDSLVTELEILCGARILDDHAVKSEIKSRPGGCVNAHVAHGPANDQLCDTVFVKFFQKPCLPKAVGIIFFNYSITCKRFDAVVNLDPGVSGRKKVAFSWLEMCWM